MSGLTLIWATDVVTALGKVDALGAAALNATTTSPSPKPLNTASFHPVADGLMDNPDTYVEDSDFVMAEPLNTLQFPNNDYLTIWFVMQIIEKHIIAYSITFQVSYKTGGMPTHRLHKIVSVQFTDTNIASDVKVNTADAASPVT